MAILDDLLDDIVHVEDDAIARGDHAAARAVEARGRRRRRRVRRRAAARRRPAATDVCALLSGGNIDPTLLISVVRHGLTRAGRYLVLRTRLPDRPGELLKLLELVAAERGNIIAIDHRREGVGLDVVETGVELTIVTRDEEHCRSSSPRSRRAATRSSHGCRQAGPS